MRNIFKIVLSVIIAVSVFICTIPVTALTNGDFTYEMFNGEAIITSYSGTATNVTVPAEIDGYTVYGIGDSAFKDNTTITSVTVNSGVKSIGTSAFENCTKLATITMPSTIMFFGENAIYNTAYYNDKSNWKLKPSDTTNGDDELPWEDIIASNLVYLYLGRILIKASFSGEYSVKYGTTVIADGAFAGSMARQVSLPNQTATIGANAFKDCKSLTQIKLSTNIQYIGKSAFENCTSLVNITLPGRELQMYASAFYNTGYYNTAENWNNDVLYNNGFAIGVNENCTIVEIADGTVGVIGEVFLDRDAIIPDSVTYISDEAFTNKETVTIYGYSGSYAQEYAITHNIKFVDLGSLLKGDVNFDGQIDRVDYNILCNISTTQQKETTLVSYAGDMDDDGAVDGIDVIILDLMLCGMPPSRIKGDADGDGDVDYFDYDLLVAISQTRARVTDNVMFLRCDLNEDGAVDSFDAVVLDLHLKNIVPLV